MISGKLFLEFVHLAWCPMEFGRDPPLPLPPDLDAFKRLIASCGKRNGGPLQKFVKKVNIPLVEVPVEQTCRSTLSLVERGLIGQFTRL